MGNNHRIVEEILSYCKEFLSSEILKSIENIKDELNEGFNLFSKKLKEEHKYHIFCAFQDNKVSLRIEIEESDSDIVLKMMDEMVVEWYANTSQELKNIFTFQIEC